MKAAYKFEARDKDEILRGFEEVTVTNISDGKTGKDGATYYTWIKYADDNTEMECLTVLMESNIWVLPTIKSVWMSH